MGAAALANWPKYPCRFYFPNRTIGMETFALLEGSDKDGFLKFPFLSENERKMLF